MNIHQPGIEIKKNLIPNYLINNVISELKTLDSDIPTHGIRNAEKKILSINQIIYHPSLLKEAENILHCSSKATKPEHRRVIHVEFSSYELPKNIQWV